MTLTTVDTEAAEKMGSIILCGLRGLCGVFLFANLW